MKKYKVNYKDRNYIVSADNHISAVNKVRKAYQDSYIKDGDPGRGIAFTFKVSTNSVIDAFKANKIELAGRKANSVPSGTSLDKLVSDIIKQNAVHIEIPGNAYSSLKLEPTIDFHTGQSTIQYLGFDTGFTMKKYGGAEAFDKAKLTAEMNKYLERLKRNISAAGIKVNQAKIEVGGSSEFYNYWRQAQSYNDAAIKDFDEKPYLNELSKLAVEGQRLKMLRHKIVEFYKNYPANKDNWLNDAKVIQWVKQARQLRDKWNRIGKILVDKFDLGSMYLFRPDDSDKEVWFTELPGSEHVGYFKNIIKAERERKGQRDAAIKDFDEVPYIKELEKIAAESEKITSVANKPNAPESAKALKNGPRAKALIANWNKIINSMLDKFPVLKKQLRTDLLPSTYNVKDVKAIIDNKRKEMLHYKEHITTIVDKIKQEYPQVTIDMKAKSGKEYTLSIKNAPTTNFKQFVVKLFNYYYFSKDKYSYTQSGSDVTINIYF